MSTSDPPPPTETAESSETTASSSSVTNDSPNYRTLVVNVIQATDLLAKDINGYSDPYCIVRTFKGTTQYKTPTIQKNLSPVWNDRFLLSLPNGHLIDLLEVSVYDYDKFSKDDLIGTVTIPLASLKLSEGVTGWHTLLTPKGDRAGKIQLTTTLFSSSTGSRFSNATPEELRRLSRIATLLDSPAKDPFTSTERKGVGLCLSGGGNRAIAFHLGALRRMNNLGVLSKIEYISAVSGGSIVAAVLLTRWGKLKKDDHGHFTNLEPLVIEPLIGFIQIDAKKKLLSMVRSTVIRLRKTRLAEIWSRYLAETLQLDVPITDIPKSPVLYIGATNMMNGGSWYFSQCSMGGDYCGVAPPADINGKLSVATCVAASSCHPLAFPPLVIEGASFQRLNDIRTLSNIHLQEISLADGGMIDNMGLEPLWGTMKTLFVSDAARPLQPTDDLQTNIIGRTSRSIDIMHVQSSTIRKRWLLSLFNCGKLHGTYWGIDSKHTNYAIDSTKGFLGDALTQLSNIKTDIEPFGDGPIRALINHGFCLADAAIRSHASDLIAPTSPLFKWPYAEISSDDAVVAVVLAFFNKSTMFEGFHNFVDKLSEILPSSSSSNTTSNRDRSASTPSATPS